MGGSDALVVTFANRCYQYQLLRLIFGSEPNRELISIAASEPTRLSLAFSAEAGQAQTDVAASPQAPSLSFLNDLETRLAADPDGVIDGLRDEYTRLLLGPEALPAPPWESVYRTKDRVLFAPETLEVRRVYVEHGFLPKGYPHEADDHLALELDFMYHLAEQAQASYQEGDLAKTRTSLAAQQAFLKDHLLRWIDRFATDIQQAGAQRFYPQMALTAARLLHEDAATLAWLLEGLEG
ncbi:MAG: molecular chaperone TorD family protein [Coriobacteriales bacterium]|jgi:TorA maturation chaperone TorD|nr:molecular chaperone TorD family protein [Coriobacteriales bacterium]